MPTIKAATTVASAIALVAGLAISAPVMATGSGSSASGTSAQSSGTGSAEGAGQAGGGATTMQGAAEGQQWTEAELRERGDELIGYDVENLDGTEVGEVQDIVLDNQNDKPHAVIEVGDIMGMGGKEIVIPFDQLRVGEDRVTLMSQKSEEDLEAMPEYQEDQFTPLE